MSQIQSTADGEGIVAASKMAVGAGGVVWYGLTLNEWVAIFTIIYFVVQTVAALPQAIKTIKTWVSKSPSNN